LRGRREDDAGVELVRTSLACIAGDLDYAVGAGERVKSGRTEVMAWVGCIDLLEWFYRAAGASVFISEQFKPWLSAE
jgi:hypothetical protein